VFHSDRANRISDATSRPDGSIVSSSATSSIPSAATTLPAGVASSSSATTWKVRFSSTTGPSGKSPETSGIGHLGSEPMSSTSAPRTIWSLVAHFWMAARIFESGWQGSSGRSVTSESKRARAGQKSNLGNRIRV
jgi:hypothetical protein